MHAGVSRRATQASFKLAINTVHVHCTVLHSYCSTGTGTVLVRAQIQIIESGDVQPLQTSKVADRPR